MSDMSSKIEAAGSSNLEAWIEWGQIFRGRLIDNCARIEAWSVELLSTTGPKSNKARPAKSHYLFGQKLAAVRKLAESGSSPLRSPSKVVGLLDRLDPYVKLRSTLGHSELDVAVRADGEPLFIFEGSRGASPIGHWRAIFTAKEIDEILREVAQLANELPHQGLKISPPSSPPPPKQAATADP